VGVSLRKPSRAPETVPESAAAPSDVAPRAAAAPEPAAPGAPVESATASVARASDAAPSERPSDIVALREPAAPAEAKAIEAFVNGAAGAFEKAASEIPPARLAEVLRRGPEGYRELVLYLPEKLAQELSLHCLEHDLDMSRLVASAIEQHLARTAGVAPAPLATPFQGRRADDPAPVNEGVLSLAARVLMGELAAWARAVWARRRAQAGAAAAAG